MKPVLLLVVAAAIGLTFTVFRDSIGVVAVVIIWAAIFVVATAFYALGWRRDAVSFRKERDEIRKERDSLSQTVGQVHVHRTSADDRVKDLEQQLKRAKEESETWSKITEEQKAGRLKAERDLDEARRKTQAEPAKPVVPGPEIYTKIGSLLSSGHPQICNPGPYTVEPGSFMVVDLHVVPEMTVKGRLVETESLPFDWMILHETELVKFQQQRKPKVAQSGHDEPAYTLEWVVPGPGPWFLVLDGYGKKTPREVSTYLR